MITKLQKAKEILLKNDYTCVLYNGIYEYHSQLKGVKPLIDFLDLKINFSGFCAADKVVGAGAAHLYVLLGIKYVWANVISTSAKQILTTNNIQLFFEKEVPYVINRTGDGICPIEACVKGISNPFDALTAIKQRLKKIL